MKTKLFSIMFVVIFLIPISLSTQYSKPAVVSSINQTRTDQWIEDLQANFNNPDWFYIHLNSTDRLKIREAMDYAIPRQVIINNYLNGFGVIPLSPILPQYGAQLNNQSNIRTYSISTASNLLSEVFGYKYSSVDNSSTPYDESAPYFEINLIVPTNNPIRLNWVNLIQSIWLTIGIKTNVVELSLNEVTNRIINNPVGFGWDYAHGGFDALAVGWYDGGVSDLYNMYNSNQTVPTGNNYYYLQNPTVDALTNTTQYDMNATQRNQAVYNFQNWYYNNIPASIVYQKIVTYAMNENLTGFNPYTVYNLENWTLNGKTNAVIAEPYGMANLNPAFYNYFSSFDDYIINPTFRGMFVKSTEYNDSSYLKWNVYPYFADWWNSSANGLTWFVNLKQGLKWSDGVALTTSDVKFTFDAELNASTGSTFYPLLSDVLSGPNSIQIINSTLIKFQFSRYYPYVMENIFTQLILPEHILKSIDPSTWSTDITNSHGIGVYNGPYTLTSNNNSVAFLQKNPIYTQAYVQKLNTSTKLNTQESGVPGLAVPSISTFTIEYQNQSNAVNLLNTGKIDFIDAWEDLSAFHNQIQTTAKIVDYFDGGWQEIGYNQASPIWGMNPIDPMSIPPTTPPSTSYSYPSGVTYTSTSLILGNPTLGIVFILLVVFVGVGMFVLAIRNRNKNNGYRNRYYQNNYRQNNSSYLQNYPYNRPPPVSTNSKQPVMSNFCSRCGQPVYPGDVFCQNCGNRL